MKARRHSSHRLGLLAPPGRLLWEPNAGCASSSISRMRPPRSRARRSSRCSTTIIIGNMELRLGEALFSGQFERQTRLHQSGDGLCAHSQFVAPRSYYNDVAKRCEVQSNLLIRDAINVLTNLPITAPKFCPNLRR